MAIELRAAPRRVRGGGGGGVGRRRPVNALDRALRSALESVYPDLATMELVDYKVRILEGTSGTDAVTRVLIDCSDGQGEWTTVGVGENVIEASWTALEQALTYGLLRRGYTQQ